MPAHGYEGKIMGSVVVLLVACFAFLLISVALARRSPIDKRPVFWSAVTAFLCGAVAVILFVTWLYNLVVK